MHSINSFEVGQTGEWRDGQTAKAIREILLNLQKGHVWLILNINIIGKEMVDYAYVRLQEKQR